MSSFEPPRDPVTGPLPTLAVLVGGPLVVGLLLALPLPGIDPIMLAETGMGSPGVLPLVSIQLLIGLRAVVLARPDLARFAALLLVGSTAAYGWRYAQVLTGLSVGFAPLVPEPGLRFAVVTAVTLAAASAVVWRLGEEIDRRTLLSSPAALGWSFLVAWWPGLQLGHGAALATDPFPSAWPWVLEPLVGVGSLAWLVLRPRTWPVRVVGALAVRSGLEAVLAAWTCGFLVWATGLGVAQVTSVAAVAAVVLVLAALARASTRSEDRGWAPVAGAVALGWVAAGAWAAGFVASGGLERARPYAAEGEGEVEVVLQSGTDAAETDIVALRERLDQLGLDGEATVTGPRELTVRLQGVADPLAVIDDLLRGGQLEILATTSRPGWDPPPGVQADPDGSTFRGAEAALRAMSAPPLTRIAVDCHTPDDCVGHLVEPPPLITSADVRRAGVGFDPQRQPFLAVEFDQDGARRFGAATADLVGRIIVLAVDGQVLLAPVVREPITGGGMHLQVVWGEDPLQEGRALAAALSHPLSGRWALAAVR